METLQTLQNSSAERNGTMIPLKAVCHPWLSKKQVDLPLQQLKWEKTTC